MSVSLEALAMAGIDSNYWAMNAEEWERNKMADDFPPHLLADEDEDDNEKVTRTDGFSSSWGRKDVGARGGIHCIFGVLCSLKGAIEKRASNELRGLLRIMVGTIVGFLMVMAMNKISAQGS